MIFLDKEKQMLQINVGSATQLADELAFLIASTVGISLEDPFDSEKRNAVIINLVSDIGVKAMEILDRTEQKARVEQKTGSAKQNASS